MKKLFLAFVAVASLASCTGSKYGCYKRGRCVDVQKTETPAQRQAAVNVA